MRYAVLHGERSGRRGSTSLLSDTVAGLRAHGHVVEVLAASSVEEAGASARSAVAAGTDVIVVVGGDGVVRIAAQACAYSDTAIAIVPAGSGNDTARSMQVPTQPRDAIAVAATGHRRTVDLVAARPLADAAGPPTYAVGSMPAALDARIAARAGRVPALFGAARYAMATVAELPRLRAADYRLRLDGELHEVSALVLTVCNLPIFGGGMRIAPAADPSDGRLDVVIIDTVGPVPAARLLRAVYAGTHAEHPAVRIVRCESVQIEGPDLMTYADGDPACPLPVTCEVAAKALDILVPS